MLTLISFALVACKTAPKEAVPPTEPPQLTLPPPRCLDHDYLPLDDMGQIISARPDEFLSFTTDELQFILDVLGEQGSLGPFEHGIDTWQVRYRTQDRGVEAEATGLVIVPRDISGPAKVVLWEHPTLGANNICAPSGLGVLTSSLPLAFAARMGVVVIAPDYLGLLNSNLISDKIHPYVVPEPTAISSLDAVRAAVELADREGWSLQTDQLAIWGVSQGGHAALWADRYQKSYAPEFGIAAVVAAIPPTDMRLLVEGAATQFTRASEALPAAVVGSADWYEIDSLDILAPEIDAMVRQKMTSGCDILDPAGEINDLSRLFAPDFQDGVLTPDWVCALEDNRLRTTPLQPSGAPILLIVGEADDLAWPEYVRQDAELFCSQGASVDFIECAGAGHEESGINTALRQEAWILDRLAGVESTESCTLPGPEPCEPFF